MVVAVEDRELGAVDRAELVGGDAEHERDECIDLDKGLAPILGDPQGSGGGPLRGDGTQVGTVRAWTPADPRVSGEVVAVDVAPEIGVGVRDAVEAQRARTSAACRG